MKFILWFFLFSIFTANAFFPAQYNYNQNLKRDLFAHAKYYRRSYDEMESPNAFYTRIGTHNELQLRKQWKEKKSPATVHPETSLDRKYEQSFNNNGTDDDAFALYLNTPF